ncbi:MAG: hypothetical protein P8H62_05205 [Henriciella sp.]|nr:hypothetical protein [Henriciella sp.]
MGRITFAFGNGLSAGQPIKNKMGERFETERRIDRIVDAIADGLASNSMKQKLMDLEAQKAANTSLLAALGESPVVTLHPQSGTLYAELVGTLADVVSDPSPDADEVRKILRKVINRIVLQPPQDEGDYHVAIRGDLAALLSQDGQTTFMMGAGGRTNQKSRLIIPFNTTG